MTGDQRVPVVLMGGPADGEVRHVHRPDYYIRVTHRVQAGRLDVRWEEAVYEPRRLVLPADIAKRAGDPGWRWVMVPLGTEQPDLDRLLARHSRPIVDGPRRPV